ncbi:NAD-dependent epimerase/dehydratase family protein [Streptoalloteichus hindustanus]|uniref:Nucleoside-diphosphate-sugar epimerase n=1 Tax=Streptoalloteichus hindustanus TaxID=2017 RepID=A0A1M5CJY4_STRHI|nr:NAD-dependent epimerase/dehydratase family protein [Streptoalloteichus hindustanus]SHF54732.1 Nucleoside-diphosphate-sugar epimerase [Streptoalloteichus hindustanus]
MRVVLGTGPVGLSLVDELVGRGYAVRVVNRSGRAELPEGSTLVRTDVSDRRALAEVIGDAEVVYNCTHVPYARQTTVLPLIQDSLIDAVGASGARLVTVETLSMYGPSGGAPMTERTPLAATSRKGRVRARMVERYLDSGLPVALGVAADFFGPRTLTSSLGAAVFPPALDGDPVAGFGDIDLPRSYTYVPDLARGLAILGEREEALGRLWHLPVAPALSTRQVHELIGEILGRPIRAYLVDRPTPWGPFDEQFMAEYAELFYWHTEPFVMDDSLFTSTFGWHATPLTEALRTTVEWFVTRKRTVF